MRGIVKVAIPSLFAMLVGGFFASCNGGASAPEGVAGNSTVASSEALKNIDYKKLSYALGLSAGQYIATEEIPLQEDDFREGLMDAIKKHPKMDEQEVMNVMQNYLTLHREAQAAMNEEKGKRFFDSIAKLDGVIADSTGLYYKILQEGIGVQPADTSTVLINYKGSFINGEMFDQNPDEPVLIDLRRVIQGWTIGIPKLKEGTKAILYIPANLAYGARGRDRIPSNSTLVFDVELVKVMTPADIEDYMKKMAAKAQHQ